jgi:hypothetical protein
MVSHWPSVKIGGGAVDAVGVTIVSPVAASSSALPVVWS